MSDERYESILQEIFEAAASGRELSLAELERRHPEHRIIVRRAFDAAQRYQKASAALSRSHSGRPAVLEALQAGDRLGDFEIEGRLASGGMGTVYRARQLALGGRMVALKVLATELADTHAAARFEREARVLAGLHHASLAEVYGYGAERGSMYFAMRLVNGPSLRDVLLQRAADPRLARADGGQRHALVERIAEVAEALAMVHAAGLVHRDVKPANIVIEGSGLADGRAVLVDFGLVRAVDSRTLTQSDNSPSTPTYAPPEQLLGNDVDARADVFSLGVTLHDLLSCRVPHVRPRASAGLEPIRELAPEVDEDLAAVVMRAVDPMAEWRYPSAVELRDDLRAWLRGEAVSARRVPLIERGRRWLARHPRRLAQIAAVLFFLLLAGLVANGPLEDFLLVRSAEAALERGDLRRLRDLTVDADTLVPFAWMASPALTEAAARLSAASDSDPVSAVAESASRNDAPTALFKAAEAVGTLGMDAEPLLERFLVNSQRDRELREGLGEEDVEAWSIQVARLFYEQAVQDRERAQRAEPFRLAVQAAWDRTLPEGYARLCLVTALGGVGRAQDLTPLLEWGMSPERPWESVRLTLANAERLILRVICLDEQDRLDTGAFWSLIARRAREIREAPNGDPLFGTADYLRRCCMAMLLAERRLGVRSDAYLEFIPPAWFQSFLAGADVRFDGWLLCLGAAQHPRFLEALTRSPLPSFLIDGPNLHCGILLGLIDDPRAVGDPKSVLARVLELRPRHSQLDDGLEFGVNARLGLPQDPRLDPESKFGRHRREPVAELASTRSTSNLDPVAVFIGPVARPLMQHLTVNPRASAGLSVLRVEAAWQCVSDHMLEAGAARRVSGIALQVQPQEQSYLRLFAFGHSEVRYEFDVPFSTTGIDRAALVTIQPNARDYYPHKGQSVLAFELNGAKLGTDRFYQHVAQEQVLHLPASSLQAGSNVLRIRLLDTSTAPVRIHRVVIKRMLWE